MGDGGLASTTGSAGTTVRPPTLTDMSMTFRLPLLATAVVLVVLMDMLDG